MVDSTRREGAVSFNKLNTSVMSIDGKFIVPIFLCKRQLAESTENSFIANVRAKSVDMFLRYRNLNVEVPMPDIVVIDTEKRTNTPYIMDHDQTLVVMKNGIVLDTLPSINEVNAEIDEREDEDPFFGFSMGRRFGFDRPSLNDVLSHAEGKVSDKKAETWLRYMTSHTKRHGGKSKKQSIDLTLG